MHNILRFFTLFLMVSIVGCGAAIPTVKPYKMDIQQGNVVTSEMLLKLRPGMSKSQVKYIMGTPLLVDSFHSDQWDYFYQLRKEGEIINQRRVILDFEGDSLARVRGDVVPEGTDIDAVMQQAKTEAEQAKEKVDNPDLVVEPIDTPEINSEKVEESTAAVAEAAEEAVKAEAPAVAAPVVPMDVPVKDELLDAVPTTEAEAVEALPEVVNAESPEMAAERAKVVIEDAVSSPTEPAPMPKVDEALVEPPVVEVPAVEAPIAEAEMEAAAEVVEKKVEVVEEKVEMANEAVEETVEAVEEIAPPEVKAKAVAAPRPATKMIPAPPVMGPVAKPKPIAIPAKPSPVAPPPAVEEKVMPVDEVEAKVVEEVEDAVEEITPPEVKAAPMPAKPEMPVEQVPAPPTPTAKGSLFNLDRFLETEPVAKQPAAPVEKTAPAVAPEAPASEEDAGLFERTLEFIGF